jgi:integrase/recombinase XerD
MYNPEQRRGMYQKPDPRKPSSPGGATKRLEALNPNGMGRYLNDFLDWTRMTGCTEQTCRSRYYGLHRFILWCDERGLQEPAELTYARLLHYQKHLYEYRKADDKPLSATTQNQRLCSLKALFRWLFKMELIPFNPASELELPRVQKALPRHILSLEEIKRILALPDLHTPWGLRDRAILETLYGTGMRRTELMQLEVSCVDFSRQTLLVRRGKGQKDRMLPLGERIAEWTGLYCQNVRPLLLNGARETALFLTDYGEAYRKNRLTDMVKKYLYHAGVDKPGACHLFRHAMATHMLDNGADIRHIQVMLGHSQLSTTEIYTRVSIEKLREVHAATHPCTARGGLFPSPLGKK